MSAVLAPSRVTTPVRAPLRPRSAVIVPVAGWIGAHVVLGVGANLSPHVATAHAGLVILVAVAVFCGSRRPERVVAVAAYAGVCDVFWRMTGSRAPWEASKYLLLFGAISVLVRFAPRRSGGILPLVVVAALVPGMAVAVLNDGLAAGREAVSGTEMGLVALGAGALAFRELVADLDDAWTLLWTMIGPLVAVLAIVTHAVLTNPDIDFGSESNFAATGGYGPNQVSSALGLVLVCSVLLSLLPRARSAWPVLAGLGVWAMWAAFLTFSRGGVYSMVLAGGAMALVGMGTRGTRARSAVVVVVAVIGLAVTFSSANDFTGSWLESRYSDSSTAGRTSIAELDLEVFGRHPLMGVGSDRAAEFRRGGGITSEAAAHTEFTRVLAEHGLFGAVALGALAVLLVQAYRRAPSGWNRLMVVALSVWALTTMLHAATRIGAVSVALALSQLRVESRRL